jgi:glycosyltransferase involved in cell wall biosynthesis
LLRNTEYKKRFSARVKILELKSHPTRNNPFLLYEIQKILRRVKPDIIHTHGAKAAILLRRLSPFYKMNHLATKHNGRKGRVFNTLPHVSVVSREAELSLRSKGRQRVRLIRNGIVPQRVQHTLDDTVFKIAAIGRLDKIKCFDILLEQLAAVRIPFQLTIAGDGEERARLQEKITELKIHEKVVLLGSSEDIPNLMASSHLVVMASRTEGFPQVMVEALFYGNVFISTPVGGTLEVLPPLFLAQHEALGSKISDVYGNYPRYYNAFKNIKNQQAENFTLSRITAEYQEYYREILG